jgi:hypothetical protein
VTAPDFVVIGAPRSGTTWLYKHLAASGDIFMPENKEPRYLAVDDENAVFHGPGDDVWASGLVRTREAYDALFAGARDGQRTGEASTDYLYRGAVAAPKLRSLAPGARLVAILRDPVERAHSAWRLLVHSGHESLSFEDGLAAEPQRIADGWGWWWHYAQHGFYARNLRPWLDTFPREQLLVLGYAEIEADPQGVLDRVTEHIGAERIQGENLGERINEAPLTRSVRKSAGRSALRRVVPPAVWSAARSLVDRVTLYKPPVGDEARETLERAYAKDLDELAGLVGAVRIHN